MCRSASRCSWRWHKGCRLVEISGPRLYGQEELVDLREKLSQTIEGPVKVYVRSKPEVVVTEEGYSSFEALREVFLERTETLHRKRIRKLIEEAL